MDQQKQPTEKFNEHDYATHPDKKWFSRTVLIPFFIFGSLLSTVVLFFILNTESGQALASNPVLREFILSTFPDAQLWVYSTLKYKQEVVLIYFYYVLLLVWASGIIVYLFVFNWRRVITYQKLVFANNQSNKVQMCTFKKAFKLIFSALFMIGFAYIVVPFSPYAAPITYEDYGAISRVGLTQYDVWNSYIGLVFMFISKVHLSFIFILMCPLLIILLLMCFKKNKFYKSK